MAEMSPKMILDKVLASLRAWTGEPLASATFRKGSQRSVRLADGDSGIVIVALEELTGGEQSAGVGNHWWENWSVLIHLAVPDDEDDPEGAEDTRLDMLHQVGLWMQANRTLFDTETEAASKRARIASARLHFGPLLEAEEQLWRQVFVSCEWGTLRS